MIRIDASRPIAIMTRDGFPDQPTYIIPATSCGTRRVFWILDLPGLYIEAGSLEAMRWEVQGAFAEEAQIYV